MKSKLQKALAVLSAISLILLSACGSAGHDGKIGEGKYTCTLTVRCDTALNADDLAPEKRELVPADGVILPVTAVCFNEGESAFDVLLRAMVHEKIHLEYSESPMYHSMYIEGINNLYEFDCGALSGWMYSVNGEFPGFGSSSYILTDGDVIEFLYTCDLGADVGGEFTG